MTIPEEPLPATDGEPPGVRDDETAKLLLATFQDRYRTEAQADEDVFRTLPFFATSLGLVLAAVGFVATRLPPWSVVEARPVLVLGGGLVGCSILAAFAVLAFLWRATAPAVVQRPEGESAILAARAKLIRDLAADAQLRPAAPRRVDELRARAGGDRGRVVARSAVNDDHLVRAVQPLEAREQRRAGVERRDDDRQPHPEQLAPPSTQKRAQCGWLSATGRIAPASVGPRSKPGL